MLLKNFIAILCLLGGVLLTTSCVKDVDFGQDDEFTISPSIAIELANFRFHSEYFTDTGKLPVTQRKDELPLQIDPDLVDQLESVEFHFKFINTFERSFKNTYTFYSGAEVQLYKVPEIQIEPGHPDNPLYQSTSVIVSGDIMSRLEDTKDLEISLSIGKEATSAGGLLTADVYAIYNFTQRRLK